MDNKTRLFGRLTKQDWIDLRVKIIATPNDQKLWKETTNLLHQRLETRYFRPIEKILLMRITSGEGFAAMTLVCSLIEFLQSCYEGKTYQYRAKETDRIYGSSGDKFKDFLEKHEPFKSIFTQPVSSPTKHIKTYADDFYSHVRCGLLHEAATNNGWTIKTFSKLKSHSGIVDLSDKNNKVIYRDKFFEEIKSFSKNYIQLVIDNKKDDNKKYLRDNLCRKLDSLCVINDTTTKWWTV